MVGSWVVVGGWVFLLYTVLYCCTTQRTAVIRLSLGRRLVNLLPVAQRTNAFANGVVDRPWVVGREFESHVHHENAF